MDKGTGVQEDPIMGWSNLKVKYQVKTNLEA